MSDRIVTDGDQAVFLPAFGAATVVVRPGRIAGSGRAAATGRPACVEGDESSVSVPGCLYVAPPFVIPGAGTLTIDSLAGDQLAATVTVGGKAPILKGGRFAARFTVASPAQQPQPTGSVPDATPSYAGQGLFVPADATVTAS